MNRAGQICGTYKSGPGGLTPAALVEMTRAAKRLALERLKQLDVAIGAGTKPTAKSSDSGAAAASTSAAAAATNSAAADA